MKRALQIILFAIVAALALPPLYYSVFPYPPPAPLPPAGTLVKLPNGNALNVIEEGAGAVVVLVHGLPGSAYDWRLTIDALAARGRRAIAVDRAGYGRSAPRADGRFSPEGNAADLLALLDALALENATVVGWSYGGATGMTAAMAKPARLARLVLVGTAGPDSADAKPPTPGVLLKAFYSGPVLRWRAAVPPIGVGLMKVLSNVAFSEKPQPAWWLEGLRANLSQPDTLLTYRSEMFGLDPESTSDFDPARIAVPTLILHGDDDRLAPVATARYLDSVIPDSTLVEYPGGSHMLPVTDADDLAERIAAFSAP